MTKTLIILVTFIIVLVTCVTAANYSLPALKNEVISTWTLSEFASMIRDAILSANPFPWDLIKNIINDSSDDFDVMTTAREVIMFELPLLIPFFLGLVCIVFVPVISLIFCCCRCCCEAKLSTRDIQNQKAVPFFVKVLTVLLMIVILCEMGRSIPLSGNRLKTSPRIIFRVVNASLEDLKMFLHAFVQDASYVAKKTLNTTIETLKTELNDLPNFLAKSVTDGAAPYVDDIENKIGSISDGITNLKTSETALNATVDSIVQLVAALQTGLTNINNRWSSLKSQCETDGKTFCNLLPVGAGPSALDININTAEVTDIKDAVSELVSTADGVDLAQYQNLGNSTFTTVPVTIRNASQTAIDTVKVTLDGVPAEIEPVIDTALQVAEVDMNFSSILDPLDEITIMLEEQYPLLNYIFSTVGGILVVLSLVVFAGCYLGALGTNRASIPGTSGRTAVGNCGANLLMVYVCMAVLPVMISLLIGSVMMLLGANLTIVCQPLQDLTLFEEIVDNGLLFGGESLGKTLLNDDSFNVSVSYLFKTCRNDDTVFKGLNIQSGMDLMSHFNVSEYVPDLGQDLIDEVNTTVDGISVVDTSLFNDLTSKLDLPDIDTSSLSTIITDLNNLNLTGTSQNMSDLADTLTDVSYKSAYQAISVDLQNLHDNTTAPIVSAVNSVQISIKEINSSCVGLKTIIADLSTNLDDLTNFIENEAVTVIVKALNDFLAAMLKVPQNMVHTVLDSLGTDVGHCKVLADIYDYFLAAICGYSLDSLNTLWAAFYIGGMVAVILMMCSCTLTKYFRTPNDRLQDRIDVHQKIGFHANPPNQLLGGSDVILTRFKNLSVTSKDENNSAVVSSYQYRRMNQRWRQRRKFITGPFSAPLFRTMSSSRKILPEPFETSISLSSVPTLNVDNGTHTMETMQDLTNHVNETVAEDNEIKIYDLENDLDTPNCNKNDDIPNTGGNDVSGKDENNNEDLDNDFMSVSDNNAIKIISRNKSDHNCYKGSTRNSMQCGLANCRYSAFLKKSKLSKTEDLNNIANKSTNEDVSDVNIKADHLVLFPASQMNKEKIGFPLQNNETELNAQPKKTSGDIQTEFWLRKYRIKDCAIGISNDVSDKLFETCSEKCNYDNKLKSSISVHSKHSVSSTPAKENSASQDSSVMFSNQQMQCYNKTVNSECYSRGKIVCALCKDKIYQNISADLASNINYKNYYHESSENNREMVAHRRNNTSLVVPPDVIVDIGDSKADRNGFRMKCSNSSRLYTDPDKSVYATSKSNQLNGNSKHIAGKLDVKVQPYKSQQRPLSPNGAFMFWKYIDGSHVSHEHGIPYVSNTLENIRSRSSGSEFVDEQFEHRCSETMLKIKPGTIHNLEEPLISSSESEVQLNSELSYVNRFEPHQTQNNIPASLQILSVKAGQQLYCQKNPNEIYCNQTSQKRMYDDQNSREVRTLSQPNSLSDLANKALVNAEKSIFYPKSSRACGSASTRRDNVQLTYC